MARKANIGSKQWTQNWNHGFLTPVLSFFQAVSVEDSKESSLVIKNLTNY